MKICGRGKHYLTVPQCIDGTLIKFNNIRYTCIKGEISSIEKKLVILNFGRFRHV
jgi:hypothetical protein